MSLGNIGIVISGGPAPGINSVIHSVVIEAANSGCKSFGLKHGFHDICNGYESAIIELSVAMVSRIFNLGGSLLSTSRFNPLQDSETRANFLAGLRKHNITMLVVVGGDGSAWVSHNLAQSFPDLRVAHVPKTIDNDLDLPHDYPSFGFETARFAGSQIIETLMTDAKTCGRWYVVETMGRKAGFLALGLGIASGATLTVIPEEFAGRRVALSEIASIILSSAKIRSTLGKPYGVALVAEGLLDAIDPATAPEVARGSRDSLGRLHYHDLELADLLVSQIRSQALTENLKLTFSAKNIGYELRCHHPVSFDIEYTRLLGFGAVRCLLEGRTDIILVREHDQVSFRSLSGMVRPDGIIRTRRVNIDSDLYKVARSFMQR